MPKFLIFFLVLFFCSDCFATNQYVRKYAFYWLNLDEQVVKKYLESSVNSGQPSFEAAFILGTLCLKNNGIFKKDLKKADYYITTAANAGHRDAIKSLADGYYSGDIRKKNLVKALEYYELAGRLSCGAAQLNAGIVAIELKNFQKAKFWLKKAAKNHDDLGEMTTYAEKKLREIS